MCFKRSALRLMKTILISLTITKLLYISMYLFENKSVKKFSKPGTQVMKNFMKNTFS